MENICIPRVIFLLFIFMFMVSLRGDEVVDGSSTAQAPTTTNNPYNITHVVTDKKDNAGGRGGGGGSGGGGRGWGGGGGGGGGSYGNGRGGGGGGGGSREGGGGGGGGGMGGSGGWGWGGGGGGWWAWGCRKQKKHNNNNNVRDRHWHMNNNQDYKLGEFAQCMVKGRCKGMRLDCPLHCGGPCFYDCIHMCKAHCRR